MSDCIHSSWPVSRDGYARRGSQNRILAHRQAYEEAYGPIPDGFHVHHTCNVPACINPDHLVAIDPAEHARITRAWDSQNHISKLRAAKTHCAQGHEFTPENTRLTAGRRACRECGRIRNRRYHTENREKITERVRRRRLSQQSLFAVEA